MKNKGILLSLSVLAISLISCENEFIVDLENSDNKIVVNAIFNNNENLSVTVTKSMSPLVFENVVELSNATVLLYENGDLMESMTYSKLANENIGSFYSTINAGEGNLYRLEVLTDDLGTASATASVPPTTPIISSSAKWTPWTALEDSAFSVRYNFKFTMVDPEIDNYYILEVSLPVYLFNHTTNQYDFYANQYAEIITSDLPRQALFLNNGLIFTDFGFNGSEKQIIGSVTMFSQPCCYEGINEADLKIDKSELQIELHSLSKEAYLYQSILAKKIASANDIYSEPTPTYNNIENGLGIFAGENISKEVVAIQY